jgi:hypothetical protein
VVHDRPGRPVGHAARRCAPARAWLSVFPEAVGEELGPGPLAVGVPGAEVPAFPEAAGGGAGQGHGDDRPVPSGRPQVAAGQLLTVSTCGPPISRTRPAGSLSTRVTSRSPDIHLPRSLAGGAVHDRADAFDRVRDPLAGPQVVDGLFHRRSIDLRTGPAAEHADRVPGAGQCLYQRPPERAGAAGHQYRLQLGPPWLRTLIKGNEPGPGA